MILGFLGNDKVDIWSLGCVFFELLTGKMFLNYNKTSLNLAKVFSLNQKKMSYFQKGENYTKFVLEDKFVIKSIISKTRM